MKKQLILGLDIDGCIRDFNQGYNETFSKHFPEHSSKILEIPNMWNCFFNYGWDEIISKRKSISKDLITKKEIEKESISWMMNEGSEQIFEHSPIYKGTKESVDLLKDFCENNNIRLKILSHQVGNGIKFTLRWLIKHQIFLKEYQFVENAKDKWNYCDVLIDDSPTVLKTKTKNKISIKVEHLYNQECQSNYSIKDLNDTEKLFKFLLEIKDKI